MRCHGVCSTVRGLGGNDHVCVVYDDTDELRRGITDFLSDGRRLGQRLLYVAPGSEERLRRNMAGLPDVSRLLGDGVLQIASLDDVYQAGEPLDVDAQLRTYARATEEALKLGFTGLRVAGEATDLVAEPGGWEAHLRWEAVADQFMSEAPMSGLCAYDRRVLSQRILGDIARLHPAVCGPEEIAPFRVFAGEGRNTLMIAGEVDYFNADDLDRLLALAKPEAGRTVLDLSGLEFIDQHGLLRIAKHVGNRTNGSSRVQNVPPQLQRLCDLIGVEV